MINSLRRTGSVDVSGAKLLNLGCGTKTADADGVVNMDWGTYARIRQSPALRRVAPYVVGKARVEKLKQLPGNVLVYDLSKGIPAADNSVDAVYHSHMLEHLDRDIAEVFVREVRRVLRPGGIHRISVPDLEPIVRTYLSNLESTNGEADHDKYIHRLLEQSVRREAAGTSSKAKPRRIVENLVLGDARKRGETHQWMYDYKNLTALLERAGFTDIQRRSFDESSIPAWNDYRLDRNLATNGEYKPDSLYMEARA